LKLGKVGKPAPERPPRTNHHKTCELTFATAARSGGCAGFSNGPGETAAWCASICGSPMMATPATPQRAMIV